ncbi:unnamed protein product [Blepharisma stoltei]|uniref:EF-hand domain-containing protein n=1 Tax=Blepharisma stoltei TaxID=1481888 RepID=A0AAU9K5M2_9CILI|nr:unnamed protein product [Blepharisma stoltei]
MDQPTDLSESIDFNIPDESPIASGDENLKNSELFVLTIEIGNEKQVNLVVHSNDDPEIIAKKFAASHNLNKTFELSLANIIKSNKELVENRVTSTSPDSALLAEFLSTPTKPSPQAVNTNKMLINKKHTPKIDKKSDEIAKKLPKQNVYTRLYKKIQKTPILSPSPDTTFKARPSSANHGEWLYVNGLRKKEELKKNAEKIKHKLEEEKVSESTFKPKINKNSTLMVPRNYEKTEDLLINKAKDYQIKLNTLRQDVLKEELKECSFSPRIIETIATKNRIVGKDYLYKEAEIKRSRSKSSSEKSISLNSPRISQKSASNSREEVFGRLYNLRFTIDAKIQHLRHKSDVSVDKATGQELFHPHVKSTSKERGDSSVPIWEHLYSQRDKHLNMIDKANEQTNEFWKATAMAQKSSENSKAIYKQFKEKQYEKLFNILDSDRDGHISSEHINKENLDQKIMHILTPFFTDLDCSNEVLNFHKFIAKLEDFMKQMTIEERAQIFKRETKVELEKTEKKSFISLGSGKIMAKSRTSRSQDFYERLMNTSKLKDDKIKKLKEVKINEEMNKCTFKPVFISKSNK